MEATFPGLKSINNFDFQLELARQAAQLGARGSVMTKEMALIVGQKFGIPANRILTGGTGGGGANRANEVASLSSLIADQAKQLGINMTPEAVASIAQLAQKEKWSATQIIDRLTQNIDWMRLNAGTIKTSAEDFKRTASRFLVNLSDQSVQDWSLRIAKGEMTEDTANQLIREQAKAANPWLGQYIDQGIDPIDVLAANRDFIARNLEMDPLGLDLMDQNILKMMTVDDGAGQRRLANQSEMTTNVRQDDRWKNTNNAKNLAAGVGQMLSRIFGRSAY
jgi:Holliday junction resolvasome RuvABC ATP-dependent DNA helicase subunit